MSQMYPRKRVRFSEDELETAITSKKDLSQASRTTLLPEPETDDNWQHRQSKDEEGPIKSTDPAFAAAVRALHRNKIDDLKVGERLELSIPDDLNVAGEEDEEVHFTEDGIPIEPFNLKAEKRSGYFDADGNYLAFREQDDTDAWLETLPDGPIDEPAPKGGHQQTRDDNVEKRPKMTSSDGQLLRQRIVQRLQSGETVLDALRRLGSSGPSSSSAVSDRSARFAAMRSRLAGTVPEENRQSFEALTEDASQLLNAGDTGVYSQKREEIVRHLRNVEALSSSYREAPGVSGSHWPSGRAALQGDVEFGGPIAMAIAEDAEREPAQPADPEADMFEDPPGGNDTTGFMGGNNSPEQPDLPADMGGFEYDEVSGMYYNTNLGCYFDTKQQLYGDASSGQWFSFEGGKYKLVST